MRKLESVHCIPLRHPLTILPDVSNRPDFQQRISESGLPGGNAAITRRNRRYKRCPLPAQSRKALELPATTEVDRAVELTQEELAYLKGLSGSPASASFLPLAAALALALALPLTGLAGLSAGASSSAAASPRVVLLRRSLLLGRGAVVSYLGRAAVDGLGFRFRRRLGLLLVGQRFAAFVVDDNLGLIQFAQTLDGAVFRSQVDPIRLAVVDLDRQGAAGMLSSVAPVRASRIRRRSSLSAAYTRRLPAATKCSKSGAHQTCLPVLAFRQNMPPSSVVT